MIQTRLTQTALASATSSPEKEPGEIDLTSLPEKEFKTKVNHADGLAEKYARTKEGEYRNKTSSGRTSKQNGQDARDHSWTRKQRKGTQRS